MGPRDVAADEVTIVRWDTREKHAVPQDTLSTVVASLLDDMQSDLFASALRSKEEHTAEVENFRELAERVAANAGWSLAHWCGDAACEARIKADTKATIRCIPRDLPVEEGACRVCAGRSSRRVVIARAY